MMDYYSGLSQYALQHDLDLNCLTKSLIVYLKEYFTKVNFEKNAQQDTERNILKKIILKKYILNETSKPPVNKAHFFSITHLLLNCLK